MKFLLEIMLIKIKRIIFLEWRKKKEIVNLKFIFSKSIF